MLALKTSRRLLRCGCLLFIDSSRLWRALDIARTHDLVVSTKPTLGIEECTLHALEWSASDQHSGASTDWACVWLDSIDSHLCHDCTSQNQDEQD